MNDVPKEKSDQELANLIYNGNNLGFLLDGRGQGVPHFHEKFRAALTYEKGSSLPITLDIAQNLRCYNFMAETDVQAYA